ncbi:MAG: nitroreductase family protein [Erysipelotrichaceae bacterium]
MTLLEAVSQRHSVRKFKPDPIDPALIEQIQAEIARINAHTGLHIQLITNEPKAFDGMMAHYGKLHGVQNYIALVGEKNKQLDKLCGYHGEHLVLLAQTLGLNTCWVAMTFSKRSAKQKIQFNHNEKLACVIALGYGTNQGHPHKSKQLIDVIDGHTLLEDWMVRGVSCALDAPTALNQQKFKFRFEGNRVSLKTGGFCSQLDYGILKYHFELGAKPNSFTWNE